MQPYSFDQVTNGGTLSVAAASTTPANVPNLTFTVLAGCTYNFETFIPWQATTTTATLKSCMAGTCTASFIVYITAVNIGTDGNASNWLQSSLTLGAGARQSAAATVATTTYWVNQRGRITVSASGTLTAQIGSGTGTGALNVQSGGVMTLVQI
jgi:hypothetical protein